MKYLKIFGYVLIVIAILILLAPWISNFVQLDFVEKLLTEYFKWVNGIFGK